jgi:hypothetical protein
MLQTCNEQEDTDRSQHEQRQLGASHPEWQTFANNQIF